MVPCRHETPQIILVYVGNLIILLLVSFQKIKVKEEHTTCSKDRASALKLGNPKNCNNLEFAKVLPLDSLENAIMGSPSVNILYL